MRFALLDACFLRSFDRIIREVSRVIDWLGERKTGFGLGLGLGLFLPAEKSSFSETVG
jgi:hypothetical protein